MALNYVTVTCDLADGQGNPNNSGGFAYFQPSGVLTDLSDHFIIGQNPLPVQFLGNTPTVRLAATDNPSITQSGWAWSVNFAAVPPLYGPSSFSFALPAGPASFTATNASPCVFTWTATAALTSLPNGTSIKLTGSPPTGFSTNTTYYVVQSSGSTFQLSATLDGSPIASSSTGSGTLTVVGMFLSAVAQVGAVAVTSPFLRAANNLSDVGSLITARTNLGFGSVSVKAYGAKGDGVTDDTAAIQAAMNAVGPTGGTVEIPPGNYIVSSTLLWKPSPGGLTNQSFNAPSLKGAGPGATSPRFLNTMTAVTTLTASGSFPVGEFLIDYIGDTGANNCISGYEISGIHLNCVSRAAGMRNCNAHTSTHRFLTINNPATPAPANNIGGPTAGLSAVASPSTNAWNNRYEDIICFNAQQDGFQFAEGNGSWVMGVNCLAGNAGRYGFQAGDASTLVSCSSQAAATADFLVYRSTLIGCNNEPWIGGCKGNAILFTGNNSRQAQVIGGEFGGNGNAGTTGTNAACISFGSGGQVFDVLLDGVSFVTEAHTTYWINIPGSATTGKIQIRNCSFSLAGGALATANYTITPVLGSTMQVAISGNQGLNPFGAQVIAVPLTTVATAALPFDSTFYITAGSTSCTVAISGGGPTITIPANQLATVRVPASCTLTPTYTNAPTWVVEGE